MVFVLVFLVALAAGGVSGVIGTGSSLLLLPVLVHAYGPKEAIPIMAVAAVLGNLSRLLVWRREIDWRAALAFALAGMPAAALGARTMLALPAWMVDLGLGVFFWAMIPGRRLLHAGGYRLSLTHLALCGAAIGFLTGLVLSTGPLSVPVFMSYGLAGGAFLGTEAASSVLVYLAKVATFALQGALTPAIALQGLLTGAGIMAGTALSKRFVLALGPRAHLLLLDGLLLVAGGLFFWLAVFR